MQYSKVSKRKRRRFACGKLMSCTLQGQFRVSHSTEQQAPEVAGPCRVLGLPGARLHTKGGVCMRCCAPGPLCRAAARVPGYGFAHGPCPARNRTCGLPTVRSCPSTAGRAELHRAWTVQNSASGALPYNTAHSASVPGLCGACQSYGVVQTTLHPAVNARWRPIKGVPQRQHGPWSL